MKIPRSFFLIALLVSLIAILAACDIGDGSEAMQEMGQANRQLSTYNDTQPAGQYDWSAEREALRRIIEARVSTTNTYTYFYPPMGTRPIFSCPSFGYPIPATAQITNPEQIVDRYEGDVAVPQIEPSGIYAPPDTDATYSICVLSNGNGAPFYWEPPVTTSPIPLKWVPDEYGGHLEPALEGSIQPLPEGSATVQFDMKAVARQVENEVTGQPVPETP